MTYYKLIRLICVLAFIMTGLVVRITYLTYNHP
jgi:hypothetical protein